MKTAPKKATRIKAGRIQRANYKWIYLFLLPTIVIFAMFYLMPIAQVFVTSFTKWDGFNAPKFNGLTNYIILFTNSSFLIALKKPALVVRDCPDAARRLRHIGRFCTVPAPPRLEVHSYSVHDPQRHQCGGLGDDLQIHFQQ